MRQIWISKRGAPDVLQVREAPEQPVGPNEVAIDVRAAGVNFADIMARMGLYPDAPPLPCVVGYEASGTIAEIGADVDGFAVGDRVTALTRFGGYSDRLVLPAIQVAAMPESLSFEAAAAIPVNYLTAWLMLVKLGNVGEGDRVLVHAAAGGVGQAAVQICRWRGATVIGTASKGKHERLLELGVEHVIDYRNEDFEAAVRARVGSVDIVLDAVGGDSFAKSYRLLAPMGRLFAFGVSSIAPGRTRSLVSALVGLARMPKFKPVQLMDDNRGVFGVNLGHLWDDVDKLRAMLGSIIECIAEGHLSPVVDRAFSFEDAGDAHAYIQGRKNFGKVVLTP
ncbi:MAG: zinc-binding dehydrogenase [Nannocystaceae bacterium]|nr:zinc-binding dehydrogenase [Nannocystaceae bacterium]